MTYDPYRSDPRSNDPYANPYRVRDPDREIGAGAGLLLAALLLFAIGGFVLFYGTGERTTIATNDLRPPITQPHNPARGNPPETTGAGAAELPQ
jgi:hypothetical protein